MTAVPLQIEQISKSFNQKHVLKDLSFEVAQGEIYGLVGLNGIGKTTLIKILLGLLKQNNGEVRIFGQYNSDISAKKRFTYLPEKFQPSPFLKGSEFLELSIGHYGKKYDNNKAIKLCEELDLDPEALSRRIGGYSKGMGQKLGLVSVFLTETPFLVLDEPMSGLDPRARICLKNKLQSYKKAGHSIFFSSHILADIEEICDKMAVLHDGHLLYEGSVNKFIKTYKTQNLEQAFLHSIAS